MDKSINLINNNLDLLKTEKITNGTLLEFILAQKANRVMFITQDYNPSDLPEQGEYFVEIFIDHVSARRMVRLISYNSQNLKIFTRQIFKSDWMGDWCNELTDYNYKKHYFRYDYQLGKDYAVQDMYYKLPTDNDVHYVIMNGNVRCHI